MLYQPIHWLAARLCRFLSPFHYESGPLVRLRSEAEKEPKSRPYGTLRGNAALTRRNAPLHARRALHGGNAALTRDAVALHGATRPYCQKNLPVNPLLHLKILHQKIFFRKYARILAKSLTYCKSDD